MDSRMPVSPVDAAWLRMDSDTNPMVITSLIGLDGPLEPAPLEQVVARMIAFPRFRQRIVAPRFGVGLAHWEDDPHFDPALHIHRVALPSPGGSIALAQLVSYIMSAPLDRSRPLWQLYVVEGVEPPLGHGTALLTRVHHCLGDGLALVQMLLAVAGVRLSPAEVGLPPLPPTVGLSERADHAMKDVAALGKLVFLPFDDRTPLSGRQSRGKRVAWSNAIPLESVKGIARALGAKTNDVLMASVTAAIRTYMLRRAALHEDLEVHAIVPVLLRGTADDAGLGNHFGLVFAALPLNIASPIERVREMKRRMDAIKASPEADVTYGILGAAGLASAQVERLVVELFSRKGSLLVTNVAGPPLPIELGGRAVESMTVWAPTAGHVALGISLLSYAGTVSMTVASDVALMRDPSLLAIAFEDDLGELARLVSSGFSKEGAQIGMR